MARSGVRQIGCSEIVPSYSRWRDAYKVNARVTVIDRRRGAPLPRREPAWLYGFIFAWLLPTALAPFVPELEQTLLPKVLAIGALVLGLFAVAVAARLIRLPAAYYSEVPAGWSWPASLDTRRHDLPRAASARRCSLN
jgi:hypothetical protein